MNKRFFGTDGIRGCVGEEPITPQTVLKLGWAAGRVLTEEGKHPGKVIIGKDTRVSGYLLESALEAGLSAAGVDISLLGPMPTPGIAYLTRTARARAGIVISASHNPFVDNGIKFFSGKGLKLPDKLEHRIERMMDQPLRSVAPVHLGRAERYADAAGRYIEYCKSTIPHRLSLNGIKLVVDCANGAAYYVAPNVFEELGADITVIANRPDGFNINEDCGSTHPQILKRTVVELGADIGIALDGDGDRVLLVDHTGEQVDGDQVLYILGLWRQRTKRINSGIAGTLMTNLGLEQACKHNAIPFARTAVGDRYVLERMIKEGWELGGESSGHIICLDKSTTGDGIIAALEVLQIMVDTGQSLAELKSGMQIYPQTMINVRLNNNGQFNIDASVTMKRALADAASELADNGRVVLRASGTEPLIRVMVEGNDAEQVKNISESLAATVKIAASEAPHNEH